METPPQAITLFTVNSTPWTFYFLTRCFQIDFLKIACAPKMNINVK